MSRKFIKKCLEEYEGGLKEVTPDDTRAEKYLLRARHHLRLTDKLIKDSDEFLRDNDIDPLSLSERSTLDKHIDDETEELFYDWGIIGAYYGIYHAILSLLVSIGYTSKNHSCAIAALEYFFYKQKEVLADRKVLVIKKIRAVEKRMVDDAWTMKDRREKTAYGVALSTERHQAEESLKEAQWFVEKVLTILEQVKKVPPKKRVEKYQV